MSDRVPPNPYSDTEQALLSVRDPLTWLQDVTFWFLDVGDIPKAQLAYELWVTLSRENEDYFSGLLQAAVEQDTQATLATLPAA